MAVVVTNMDMPDKCLNCRMQYNEAMEGRYGGVQMNYFCAALAKFIGHELCTGKRPDCPLRDMQDKDGKQCSSK